MCGCNAACQQQRQGLLFLTGLGITPQKANREDVLLSEDAGHASVPTLLVLVQV